MKRQNEVRLIPLNEIQLAANVRTSYSHEQLADLAASIKAQGLLQPVTVLGDSPPVLLLGHRRFAAFQLLAKTDPEGYGSIPALVAQDLDATTVKEVQLIENIQRENLSAQDIIETLTWFRDQGLNHRTIAEKIGKSLGYVRNMFSSINSIEANPELGQLVRNTASVTMADINEVQGLDSRSQVKLLKDRAKGTITSLKGLREIVQRYKVRGDSPRISRNSIRLSKGEIVFLPVKFRLAEMDPEQKQELRDLLTQALQMLV